MEGGRHTCRTMKRCKSQVCCCVRLLTSDNTVPACLDLMMEVSIGDMLCDGLPVMARYCT